MTKRDYYEVLGLARNATPDEIKKTFRRQAAKLHPDNKDSGDEAAFKELAEAYEILSDEQKRATYDRYGHEGVKGSTRGFDNVDFSSMQGFGIDDFIEFFFGGGMRQGGGRRGGPEQGSHLKFDLEIEFLEAVFGTEKKINIRRLEDCTTCEGSGAAPGTTPVTCVACAGMGQVQQVVNSFFGQTMRVIECPTCRGTGKKIDKPCRDCKGEAMVRKAREFQLTIPAGIEPGARLRLTSAGDKGRRGGTYGDLFVVCHVKDHKQFIRDGETIHIKQPISYSMAALGGEMMIPTVDGNRPLKLNAGIQNGATQIMREMGVPRFNNPTRRGDQVVHLVIETPTKLSAEEKKLLEKLAELRSESLQLTQEELAEIEARKDAAAKDAAAAKEAAREAAATAKAAASASAKTKGSKKDEEKEDSSIIDKIVDAFRPKGDEAK